jgi:glycosyltransferase 2 family protein
VKLGWRGVLGISLSIFLLWLTLRGVDINEVWGILSTSSLPLWILCTVTATAIFPLRARRWQAILAPLGPRIPFAPLWHATAIGMMVNNVFPARAGEFARAFALSRERRDVPLTTAFASLAVDRLFDGVVVLGLMVAATFDPAFPADATILGATAGGIALSASAFLAVVLVGLYSLVLAPALFIGIAERMVGLIWKKGVPKVHAFLTGFVAGLGVLQQPKLALEVFVWTLIHWLTNALFIQALIAIGVAIPSSPGFFGPFEAAGKAGLALYAVPAASAVSWAIGFHLLSFVPITVIGAWYFTRLDLHVRDLAGAPSKDAA